MTGLDNPGLDNDGYVLIKHKMSGESVTKILNCTNEDNLVKYDTVIDFIHDDFLPTISRNIPQFTEPMFSKFRYSNNNNSKDAATFHGDVYNHSDLELMPIYTCLCYFDESQMELIPKSHVKTKDNENTLNLFNRKIQINLNRGDILVFHSNIYHRGINYYKTENRRLLQVFDVFPNKEIYDKHIHHLCTVKTTAISLLTMSKYDALINSVNFVNLFLVNNDLQYKLNMQDIPDSEKKGRFISYEPEKRKQVDELSEYDDLNINVICDKNLITIPSSNHYFIIACVIAVCVVIMIMAGALYVRSKLFTKKMNLLKKYRVRNISKLT